MLGALLVFWNILPKEKEDEVEVSFGFAFYLQMVGNVFDVTLNKEETVAKILLYILRHYQ